MNDDNDVNEWYPAHQPIFKMCSRSRGTNPLLLRPRPKCLFSLPSAAITRYAVPQKTSRRWRTPKANVSPFRRVCFLQITFACHRFSLRFYTLLLKFSSSAGRSRTQCWFSGGRGEVSLVSAFSDFRGALWSFFFFFQNHYSAVELWSNVFFERSLFLLVPLSARVHNECGFPGAALRGRKAQ